MWFLPFSSYLLMTSNNFEKGVKMNNKFHFLRLFFNVFGVFSSLDRFESGTKSEKDIQIMMSLHIIITDTNPALS